MLTVVAGKRAIIQIGVDEFVFRMKVEISEIISASGIRSFFSSTNVLKFEQPILLILLFVLSFFIYVARRLYFYQPKEQLDNYENLELRGIKGWLLFPVIETIASPLLIIGGLYKEFGFVLLHST